MRVGILTLHSQLNYGGVLQAVALLTALENRGCDVCVVDRWRTPSNMDLLGPWVAGGWREKCRTFIRVIFGLGELKRQIRYRRTVRFVRKRLRLTPEHFVDWNEPVAQHLPIECLIVGSDQVWHSGDWGDPRPYLLEGAPRTLSAIAYATSFGMRQIPKELEPLYREGFRRFSAISVREAEGIQLVESMGASAIHVVDPTLLLNLEDWRKFLTVKPVHRPFLMAYLISEDIQRVLPKLEAFACRQQVNVFVFVNSRILSFPKNLKMLFSQLQWVSQRLVSPVKLCLSAGPQEFLDALAQADWVLSDSFHALMFSSIFDKQVAILRPTTDARKAMFARIEEFVATTTDGPVIEDSVESALARFERGEKMSFRHDVIAKRREASWAWLKAALDKVERERGHVKLTAKDAKACR